MITQLPPALAGPAKHAPARRVTSRSLVDQDVLGMAWSFVDQSLEGTYRTFFLWKVFRCFFVKLLHLRLMGYDSSASWQPHFRWLIGAVSSPSCGTWPASLWGDAGPRPGMGTDPYRQSAMRAMPLSAARLSHVNYGSK
jgi:hypothetical protein